MSMTWQKWVAVTLALGAMSPLPAAADFWEDCTLAAPQPVFKKGGFRLDKVSGLATETFKLSEGITLRLEQRHCEYVSKTYTFVLSEKPDNTNIVGWQYGKAIELLSLLESASNPKLKFAEEKKALKAYLAAVQLPKEDVEINVRPARYQFYNLISVASKQTEKDTRVIVAIWSGPY